jgi:lipopolysaccharide transport system ATP-binding protein
MSSEFALRVSGLSKCYQMYARPQDRLWQTLWRGRRQFFREFWALRDVSFELAKGEAMAIIGRNGSGKSTLLQLIVGTLTPTAGSVQAGGRVAGLLELGSGFNPEFTGRENVYLNAAILGLDHAETGRRFQDIEAFADIGDFIDQPVKTYSSGMMMRLAFAVSVNVEPDILVIDEALAVGDVVFQFRCMERLHRLAASGTTLLFVSHDLKTVKAFCRRALYLHAGQLRGVGAAEEMVEMYLADTRELQRKSFAEGGARPERAVAAPRSVMGEGRIVDAHFADTGAKRAVYAYGDEIRFRVEIEYDAELSAPALSLQIQDLRTITIAGKIYPIAPRQGEKGMRRTTIEFALRNVLDSGAFFVTLRLENRLGLTTVIPIDKQVGVLAFEVTRRVDQDFLGMVDLPISCGELSPEAAAPLPPPRP